MKRLPAFCLNRICGIAGNKNFVKEHQNILPEAGITKPKQIISISTPLSPGEADADNNFNPKQLFYRIKQTDMDGRYTYSSIQAVPADHGKTAVTVYPVPAGDNFYPGNITAAQVKKAALIAVNGVTLKNRNAMSTAFSIAEFPTGIYIVKVERNDGTAEILKLTKK